MTDPGPATTIAGRYELTRRIGDGGMGQVWRGYDTVLDRDVAVKLINPNILDSPERGEFLARFRREARVTARIGHAGVPAVYDAAFDGDTEQLFMVMQLIDGLSLAEIRRRASAALPVDWAVCTAAQICAILSYAHAIPVIHRDLKPRNIMIDWAGDVTLLDFGIAAVLRPDLSRLTSTGQVLGTRPYMSPEQIRSTPVSPRSDLYALGCLLHELLSGHRVFEATDEAALIYQHLSAAPTPLRELRPSTPAALEHLVLDLLAKEPADRPASAWDVRDRLAPFLPTADQRRAGQADIHPSSSSHPTPAIPDPTRPFRYPVAPLPRTRPAAPTEVGGGRVTGARTIGSSPNTPSPDAAPATVTPMSDGQLDAVHAHALELCEEERFSQAVDVLRRAIAAVAGARPAEDPHLVRLRLALASALLSGGDVGRALPELDDLARLLAEVHGPTDDQALACRRQAAFCHAELGEFDEALRDVLLLQAPTASRHGTGSEYAVELALDIARFQAAAGHTRSARRTLMRIQADAQARLGRQHPLLQQAGSLLIRLPPREKHLEV